MDPLDDDFIANLLKSEAKAKASDYKSRGLQAFFPSRPASGAPKPNTRFLRNLVRDVDSHNAALREQEALNKGSRLRSKDIARLSTDPRSSGRYERSDKERHRCKRRHTRSRSPEDEDVKKVRRSQNRSASPKSRRSSHRRDERKSSQGRSREVSPRRYEKSHVSERHARRRRSLDRSHSPRRSKPKKHEDRSSHRKRTKDQEHIPNPLYYDSSDPLEDIVGPLQPASPRPRGRGTRGKTSMDERFKDSYDPSTDLQPASDEDAEWDNAVEAFRDRIKWKQQGAERLRSAGFDEEFISAWENNTIEDESSLRWTQRGATREWDRGKVIDEETGIVQVKAQWAQSKGD